MRRIDRIRSMSVTEMADTLMDTGMDNYIDFCESKPECSDCLDNQPDGVSQEWCKECLVKWLMEEG